jgi:3-oxoacyl-[acyl-carrier protein] reductase
MNELRPSALITGASRGIGLGIARQLASQGWSLTLNARNAERLEAVKAELTAVGAVVQVFAGDMADEPGVNALVDFHEATDGKLNALILAAGVGSAAALEGYPMSRLDKQLAVNVRGPFALVSRCLPLLRKGADADPARGGRIVALTSIEGVYPETGLSAYGLSKAALMSLMRSVNIEYGTDGITASAVSPGFVDTEMSAWTTDTIPADTMIQVADVVKVVDLILSVSPTTVLPHIIMNRGGASPYQA